MSRVVRNFEKRVKRLHLVWTACESQRKTVLATMSAKKISKLSDGELFELLSNGLLEE